MTALIDPGVLAAAVAAVRTGRVVGLPTDTVYGIGADPFSFPAVGRLFAAKGRPPAKPIPILVADLAGAERMGVFDAPAAAIAERYWPGPLTLVVPRAPEVPNWVGSEADGTVGIRVPGHPAALALLRATGPLAVTSANRSGEPAARDSAEAEATLGDAVAVYLPGPSGGDEPSTVVDLSSPDPRVRRPGPLPWPPEG